MVLEIDIEGRCSVIGTKAGWLNRKLKWEGRRFAPDRLFTKDDTVKIIEFKQHGKVAEGGQAMELAKFQKVSPGVFHQCDSVEKFCEILGLPFEEDYLMPGELLARQARRRSGT